MQATTETVSNFLLELEVALFKLASILERSTPLLHPEIWQERVNALQSLRQLNNASRYYSYLSYENEPLQHGKDYDYFMLIKKIYDTSHNGYPWSCYNAFLTDLKTLITTYEPHFKNQESLNFSNHLAKPSAVKKPDLKKKQEQTTKIHKHNRSLEQKITEMKKKLASQTQLNKELTADLANLQKYHFTQDEYQEKAEELTTTQKKILDKKAQKYIAEYKKNETILQDLLTVNHSLKEKIIHYQESLLNLESDPFKYHS